jgi:hypothetical protein
MHRRAYGYRDEEYMRPCLPTGRLKILTAFLPTYLPAGRPKK